jgi:hypothetical protein
LTWAAPFSVYREDPRGLSNVTARPTAAPPTLGRWVGVVAGEDPTLIVEADTNQTGGDLNDI